MSEDSNPHTDIYLDPVARLRTYDLLATLYLSELDAGQLPDILRVWPGFDDLVPAQAELPVWLEEEAAEYHRLFVMNAYPYESIYLDRELMLNTAASDSVAAFYEECGFDAAHYGAGAPDHLGVELSLMRDLIATEHRADQTGDNQMAEWARDQQARFLAEHLAQWAPIYARDAISVTRSSLYRLAISLTIELVLSDLSSLCDPRTLKPVESQPHEDDTGGREQDEVGVNKITRRLITPADVGVLITRADIRAMAGRVDLPVSVGDRFDMMHSLLTAAGEFDCLPELLDELDEILKQAGTDLAEIEAAYPAYAPYAQTWQGRIHAGRALLGDMKSQLTEPPTLLTGDHRQWEGR